jgi:acyl transferase domain-containing protein
VTGNQLSYEVAQTGRDPIAIVGIGCRFPGIDSTESFWRVLSEGIETVGIYPGGRIDLIDSVYSGVEIATRRGGFLPDLAGFDARFFEISSREARLLDPQQRLLLEVSWEALENAGIPANKIAGSRAGVFVGAWTSDYEACARELVPDNFYATTGTGRYAISGRLAYFLDLRGPALTVDTACSASLVAIHLACQSLRTGESDLALAAGVNVILRPEVTQAFSAARMLSPDGRSKFGDASANGYVRSEGAGVLVLKPLARALADGDPIQGLIRGSAINNEGRSSGQMIAPSREGQEALLRAAFADAGVCPEAFDYIEAHGTGTIAGDPVEIETIGRIMAGAPRKRPCAIGSVKTNIGHAESAAGISGVIKTVLAMRHGIIPASLHFRKPNPAIAWNEIPVAIQTQAGPWPGDSGRRIAGVSSFGLTGTNAHVVLESPGPLPRPEIAPDCARLYLLSANTPEALRAVAASWRSRLSENPQWPDSMADLAFTAATRRTLHDFRLGVTAQDRGELESRLTAWLQGEPVGISGKRTSAAHRTVFVFPGQGGQWAGMGRSLLREERIFREAVEDCGRIIQGFTGWSVMEQLLSAEGESCFSRVDIVQPTLFAVMIGLTALWRSWGLEPDAVVGHSMGECVAAAVSGALSLEDAAAVICHRSLLMKQASGRGLMALTHLSLEDAIPLISQYAGRLSVAASNSPTTTVLSGDKDAIEAVLEDLERREIFGRRIKVDVASHSTHMDSLCEDLARRLEGIRPRTGTIPFYSTTLGRIEHGAGLTADYWARNLREPVLFSTTVKRLLSDGFDSFLEINAHPVLLDAVEETARDAGKSIVATACLHRDQDERSGLLDATAHLVVNGRAIGMDRIYPKGVCIDLPAYPWQRERHWLDQSTGASRKGAAETLSCVDHIYELAWTLANPPDEASGAPRNGWLVVGETRLAEQVAARLQSMGNECMHLANADQFANAIESFGTLCSGVIHVPAPGSEPHEIIEATHEIVRLVQALTTGALAEAPRLWLLTSGSFQLPGDGEELSVVGSPAWGLARVIASEYPELRCVNVDLSLKPSPEELETLGRLIRQNGPEEQLAVRGRDCFVARYQQNEEVRTGGLVSLRPDATYLVTGGLGGIGLELTQWLVGRGARHIALLGRSAPSEKARERLAAIESQGVSVRVFSADVSDENQLALALIEINGKMPQLRGVFHLSVVTDGALLADLDQKRLEHVMLPKASGAWNLHRQLERTELDFFVLFSSITAAYGQPGVGNYAAANAFLDSLARYRRARGLPALSIEWCPWTALGLASHERGQATAKRYLDQGIDAVPAAAAFDALGRMMLLKAPSLLVMPARWDQFKCSFENGGVPRAFLRVAGSTGFEMPGRAEESIREKLANASGGRAMRVLLEAHVQEIAARVLKTAAHRVELDRPLGSMGLTSLMALELVRHLSATTGVRLPATAVFNRPTIVLLSEELARRMGIALEEAVLPAMADAAGYATKSVPANDTSDEEAIAALTGQNRNRL